MKILLISNAFPNSAEPNRGIFTYQIVKELKACCDIEVVSPLPWVPSFFKKNLLSRYPFARVAMKERVLDSEVYHPRYLVIPKILGFMHPTFMFPSLYRLSKKLAMKRPFDVINAQWVFPDGIAAAWIGAILRTPVVLSALGCDINLYSKMVLRRAQISWAVKQATFVTAVSEELKTRMVALGTPHRKIRVIKNGVDLDLFRIMDRGESRRKLGIGPQNLIILTVGTQDEVKGTKYLIEAFALMKKKTGVPAILVCIGDGPLRNHLVCTARDLGVQDRVILAGRKRHKEIPLWMNAADLFCLPSIREGDPNVVLEALACGTPVVASKVGTLSELIGNYNGRLCRVADSQNLCHQLSESLYINWNRNAIRRTVMDRDWSRCAQEYLAVYEETAKMRGKM